MIGKIVQRRKLLLLLARKHDPRLFEQLSKRWIGIIPSKELFPYIEQLLRPRVSAAIMAYRQWRKLKRL